MGILRSAISFATYVCFYTKFCIYSDNCNWMHTHTHNCYVEATKLKHSIKMSKSEESTNEFHWQINYNEKMP